MKWRAWRAIGSNAISSWLHKSLEPGRPTRRTPSQGGLIAVTAIKPKLRTREQADELKIEIDRLGSMDLMPSGPRRGAPS
jgi:hypothetical protein